MVKVIPEKCIGCNSCVLVDETIFEMISTDKGMKARVLPGKERIDNENVEDAIEICPTQAIEK